MSVLLIYTLWFFASTLQSFCHKCQFRPIIMYNTILKFKNVSNKLILYVPHFFSHVMDINQTKSLIFLHTVKNFLANIYHSYSDIFSILIKTPIGNFLQYCKFKTILFGIKMKVVEITKNGQFIYHMIGGWREEIMTQWKNLVGDNIQWLEEINAKKRNI